jgi:hypothetical protein
MLYSSLPQSGNCVGSGYNRQKIAAGPFTWRLLRIVAGNVFHTTDIGCGKIQNSDAQSFPQPRIGVQAIFFP